MGLSGPKKRTKISSDPNNLTWANSTDSFGHKILTAKGWKPGEYLGARDAAQAEHYTAANASSIRVLLREDNLGLGAQIGKGNAETFGLSMFSGLLGRLNGKSDAELQTQQNAQRDVELRMYQASKYGTLNFVYGGLLVGDKMEDRKLKDVLGSDKADKISVGASVANSRKRKAGEEEGEGGEAILKKKSRKEKKRKGKDENETTSSDRESVGRSASKVLKKKDRNGKARKSDILPGAKATSGSDGESNEHLYSEKQGSSSKRQTEKRNDKTGMQVETDAEKALRKQEKQARKEERRKRKEEKRKRKAERKAVVSEVPAPASSSTSEDEESVPPASQPQVAINRHAVRHRYIQQKRMASMNPQALKEIFMLQAAS